MYLFVGVLGGGSFPVPGSVLIGVDGGAIGVNTPHVF